jgi:hypothetical protein
MRGVLGPHAELINAHAWKQATLPATDGGLGISSVAMMSAGGVIRAHVDRVKAHADGGDVGSAKKRVEELTEAAYARTREALRRSAGAHLARLEDVMRAGGTSWVTVVANDAHQTLLPPSVASAAYATHLGLAVLGDEQAAPGKCTDCNDAIHDRFASHALKCKSFVTPRHNAARDLLRHIITPIADGDVEIEQSCGVDGRPKQTHNAPGEFRHEVMLLCD